jgi:hypothetical protein
MLIRMSTRLMMSRTENKIPAMAAARGVFILSWVMAGS